MTGTPSRTARVSTARWNLKEAEGKLPARGTRTVYEAPARWARGPLDSKPEVIRIGPAYMRRVYGRQVTRLPLRGLPFCLVLAASQGVVMGRQKSAEAIVAACVPSRRAEQCEPNRRRAFDA
jgi:hypothetical protein